MTTQNDQNCLRILIFLFFRPNVSFKLEKSTKKPSIFGVFHAHNGKKQTSKKAMKQHVAAKVFTIKVDQN